VPVEGGAEAALSPATMYAVESGTALIMGLLNKRCTDKGNSLEDCIANTVPAPVASKIQASHEDVPSPPPASSSASVPGNAVTSLLVKLPKITLLLTIVALFA
jgi:hypothetical protein